MRGTNIQNASYQRCEHPGFPGESSGGTTHLGDGVDVGVEAVLHTVAHLPALGLAKVDAAGELAHNHDVRALHNLPLQGRGVYELQASSEGIPGNNSIPKM
eukprot:9497899-Pyramimonas_sp.AAC.2